jgi:hypothetical protein
MSTPELPVSGAILATACLGSRFHMMTIFGDFRQFSAISYNFGQKIGIFLKTGVIIHFFAKTSRIVKQKRQIIRQIKKNRYIVTCWALQSCERSSF